MSERVTLSVVMIAKDEEERIGASLASVLCRLEDGSDFADEVLVVDTGSSDDTMDVARELGARVSELPFEGFGPTKQKALEMAGGDWILALAAAEIVPAPLREEIRRAIESAERNGYHVPRIAWFLGSEIRHGGWGRDSVLRLARRGHCRYDGALVHEKIEVDGPVGRLEAAIEHHGDPSFSRVLSKIDHYSTAAARKLADDPGRRTGAAAAFGHAWAKFWGMILIKQGWRDGIHGWLLAATSAYSSFLRYSKAELIRRGEDDCL